MHFGQYSFTIASPGTSESPMGSIGWFSQYTLNKNIFFDKWNSIKIRIFKGFTYKNKYILNLHVDVKTKLTR